MPGATTPGIVASRDPPSDPDHPAASGAGVAASSEIAAPVAHVTAAVAVRLPAVHPPFRVVGPSIHLASLRCGRQPQPDDEDS